MNGRGMETKQTDSKLGSGRSMPGSPRTRVCIPDFSVSSACLRFAPFPCHPFP